MLLDCHHVTTIDYSVVCELRDLLRQFQLQNVELVFSRLQVTLLTLAPARSATFKESKKIQNLISYGFAKNSWLLQQTAIYSVLEQEVKKGRERLAIEKISWDAAFSQASVWCRGVLHCCPLPLPTNLIGLPECCARAWKFVQSPSTSCAITSQTLYLLCFLLLVSLCVTLNNNLELIGYLIDLWKNCPHSHWRYMKEPVAQPEHTGQIQRDD